MKFLIKKEGNLNKKNFDKEIYEKRRILIRY